MFSSRPSAKACVVCSQDAVQALSHRLPNLQRSIRRQERRDFSHQATRPLRSSRPFQRAHPVNTLRQSNANPAREPQNGHRHASTHADAALREAVCNLADQITQQQAELVEALAELEVSDNSPRLSPEKGQDVAEAIRSYQEVLEEQLLLASNPFSGESDVETTEAEPDRPDALTDSLSEIDPTLSLEERRALLAEHLGVQRDYVVDEDDEPIHQESRMHPHTAEGKSGTIPKTVYLPQHSMVKPVAAMLSDYSNNHLRENARKVFGGHSLPLSTKVAKTHSQAPIPLTASQSGMSPMEANSFLGALYPGIYASAMNVLVEVRKRLGAEWLRDLISKEGGPKVLDVGGGGAGIIAWREIVNAEWSVMSPGAPIGSPVPYGKSTVLTGSDVLRHRASELLGNTTFLPRLPNYLHAKPPGFTDKDNENFQPQRKQFDVIVASHSVLPLEEDYERKDHVRNLWSMLNPEGGVLILLEKGHPQGFDAIGGARQMILDKLISSQGSSEYVSPAKDEAAEKEKGMIIAPCTNHSSCPLYIPTTDGKRASYHCHFSQRYVRPRYLQTLLNAKDRNHEDVLFSYLAVQRGVDQREVRGLTQGQQATDAAFRGFHETAEGKEESSQDEESVPPVTSTATEPSKQSFPYDPLVTPRIISPPLKRKGHVLMDTCTPAGKMERWIVPRSYSKQAFRDARKSVWGDLWALGAKTRMLRKISATATAEVRSKNKRTQKDMEEEETGDSSLDSWELPSDADIEVPQLERTLKKFKIPGEPGGHDKPQRLGPGNRKYPRRGSARNPKSGNIR